MWGAIISGIGMGMDSLASKGAAREVRKIADINANLVWEEGVEERRRLARDIDQTEGLMSAMSAASGVQSTGSRDLAMQGVKKENRLQLDWLMKSSKQKTKAIRRGGQLQASQLKSQAQSQAIQGFGQIAQGIYSNYNTGG